MAKRQWKVGKCQRGTRNCGRRSENVTQSQTLSMLTPMRGMVGKMAYMWSADKYGRARSLEMVPAPRRRQFGGVVICLIRGRQSIK
jgi:hypothetical protein